jgi:hypothetical protein
MVNIFAKDALDLSVGCARQLKLKFIAQIKKLRITGYVIFVRLNHFS